MNISYMMEINKKMKEQQPQGMEKLKSMKIEEISVLHVLDAVDIDDNYRKEENENTIARRNGTWTPPRFRDELEEWADIVLTRYENYIEYIIENDNEEEILENYETIISFMYKYDKEYYQTEINQIELWIKEPSVLFSLMKELA